jgi:hypothetical protein
MISINKKGYSLLKNDSNNNDINIKNHINFDSKFFIDGINKYEINQIEDFSKFSKKYFCLYIGNLLLFFILIINYMYFLYNFFNIDMIIISKLLLRDNIIGIICILISFSLWIAKLSSQINLSIIIRRIKITLEKSKKLMKKTNY